ncbi:hypothetical protein [Nocardioides sp. zg-1230]|uniref:hypothetical protein n=1 Tax=Nocardioides sp. zg-1230 TaxID=2736601 RepID=UPI001557591E|nr:hypothetical protein [Nocardioides sp. zg-1230]NPC42949.1 hypothetical protein [Nocardioides sp. zg-1230]
MNKRLTGLTGLAFALIYFVYFTMLDTPDISTSNQGALDFWTDSENRVQAIVAATLCGVSVLLFIAFVVGLAQLLHKGGAGQASHGVRIAGSITATVLLVGGAIFAAPPLALSLNNESVPMDAELGLAVRVSSFVAHPIVLWFAGFGGAALIAATTAGRNALGWRRWTIVLGVILVLALLAPLVFVGLMLMVLWVGGVSIGFLLPDSGRPSRAGGKSTSSNREDVLPGGDR